MHAFELQPANAQLLRQMVAATGLPVTVHSTAVSNFTGTAYTASAVAAGSESHGLLHKARKNDIAQPVTTVDTFMNAHSIDRVQFASIDTEGTPCTPRLSMTSPVTGALTACARR